MTSASCATGRSLVPAVTTQTCPTGAGRSPGAGSQNVRASRSCSACGKCRGEVVGLGRIHPRGEAVLPGRRESPDRPFDPFRRLPLGEHDFREPAPVLAARGRAWRTRAPRPPACSQQLRGDASIGSVATCAPVRGSPRSSLRGMPQLRKLEGFSRSPPTASILRPARPIHPIQADFRAPARTRLSGMRS